ncbi:MAG: carboxypeptidase M32 [Candidatus Paceibacterota bacterium]|jgi:carboxypeptidase Taq
MDPKPIDILRERLREASHLGATVALLDWDQEVNMPAKGANARAAAIAYLSAVVHNKFVAIDEDGLLTGLKKLLDNPPADINQALTKREAVIVRETWRSYEKEKKLPETFVKKLAEASSKSQIVWAEARAKNDFALWLPWLEKIIKLKQQEAEYLGYQNSPYDALIDAYEPGMTTAETARVLGELKDFLLPFLRQTKASKTKIETKKILGRFPISQQVTLNKLIAGQMGFDIEAGRLDKSVHPFSTNFHPTDVRMTTRYREDDVLYSIGSTIHETGHALYEQNLPAEDFGTPLAETVSMGIHESQSRLWENNIGQSLPFWQYFYPKLQVAFPKPFKRLKLAKLYQIINKVEPSLVRTEADEVTYNLHIILRFELERALIEGQLEAGELPQAWNTKMKEYLGLEVPNDQLGVLQDIHWAGGDIGYFATYSLGNLYAAQFYQQLRKDLPELDQQIATGDFSKINHWLKQNIHRHGKTYRAGELIKKVTGEELTSRYFIDYLKAKYQKIYNL